MQIGYVRVTQGDENGLLVQRQVRTDSTHVLNRLQRVSEAQRVGRGCTEVAASARPGRVV